MIKIIIDIITNPISCLIILCALTGVGCAIRSIWRIRQEEKELKGFRLNESIQNETSLDKRLNTIKAWLQEKMKTGNEEKNAQWKSGELSIGFSHLVLRVQTLYRALMDENGARQLPQLHDLRELTLQDEMSHKSTAWLRTIISFLLILGILGTLYGVHRAIDGEIINIEALGPALLPSMVAVLCTVLLLWCRGYYTYKLESYLHKLDKCTITELIPHLQPENEASHSAHLLNEQKERLNESMHHIQETAKNLEDASITLEESMQKYKEVSEEVCQLREKINTIVGTLQSNQKEQDESLFTLQEALSEVLPVSMRELTLSSDELKEFKIRVDKTKETFDKICDSTLKSTHKLEGNIELLKEVSNTVKNLPEYAKAIREHEENLKTLISQSVEVDQAIRSISEKHDSIEHLAESVEKSSEEFGISLHEANKMLSDIKSDSESYTQAVHQHMIHLHEAKDRLNTRYDEMDEARKQLMKTFHKRTGAITRTKE